MCTACGCIHPLKVFTHLAASPQVLFTLAAFTAATLPKPQLAQELSQTPRLFHEQFSSMKTSL